MIKTLAAAFALFFAVSPALAEAPLSDDQVTRFIATLRPVEEMGKRLEAEGKIAETFGEEKPTLGSEFKPYSKGVASLKRDYPGEYAALGGALKPHGFSQDEWAATGDRVMRAYIAVKLEKENPDYEKQMAAMDPSMLSQLPPQMRAQIEGAFAMIETVKSTPATDKAAVKPHVAAIEAATDIAAH
ncbi:MAG: hypothetical protein R3C42_04970 [Parvularculaceae bacterium]